MKNLHLTSLLLLSIKIIFFKQNCVQYNPSEHTHTCIGISLHAALYTDWTDCALPFYKQEINTNPYAECVCVHFDISQIGIINIYELGSMSETYCKFWLAGENWYNINDHIQLAHFY